MKWYYIIKFFNLKIMRPSRSLPLTQIEDSPMEALGDMVSSSLRLSNAIGKQALKAGKNAAPHVKQAASSTVQLVGHVVSTATPVTISIVTSAAPILGNMMCNVVTIGTGVACTVIQGIPPAASATYNAGAVLVTNIASMLPLSNPSTPQATIHTAGYSEDDEIELVDEKNTETKTINILRPEVIPEDPPVIPSSTTIIEVFQPIIPADLSLITPVATSPIAEQSTDLDLSSEILLGSHSHISDFMEKITHNDHNGAS